MTEQDFDAIYSFAKSAGWEMSYDLNLLYRNNSQWNSSNAVMLLEYAASTGQVIDLELGNEPNLYQFTKHVDPAQIGRDYVHLRALMNTMPPFNTRRLIGPSVTHAFTADYAAKFLSTGSTSVDVFSIHHYYSSGPALTPQDMINPTVLDSITDTLNKARDAVSKYSRGTHTVWLGETGLAYSRSAPNTTGYIAGFMWLDKIGMAATHGVSLLARQSFPSFYDENETPTPEYWLTLLFKRLMGRRVLEVTSTEGNHFFRMYAHCSLNHPGGVAFYFLNIYSSDVELTIPSFTSHSYELFSLSAGGNGTMSTSIVNLNGHPVTMDGDNLPELSPVTSQTWPVVIPKFTYGFLVLPDAYVMACR
ncbi:heparanase-like [Liolophura sinensis]|uniref:heparanase-like n=1 Tax=Liolophura sinensis TaxID=3198878 RepID=UPI003158E446